MEANKLDSAYQLYQGMLGFVSGGLLGRGLGQGRQQLTYLPEAHTDFIFPIYSEEFGAQVIYTDDYIDAIVEEAFAKKVGGRSLKAAILKSFKKADRAMLHECALHPDRKKVLKLTGETVVDNRKFTI